MILVPCNTCRLKATCELRAEKRRILRGSKLTSARFNCTFQRDDLPPGAVVDARLEYVFRGAYSPESEDEPELPIREPGVLRGIVMRWTHGKVLVYFPEQPEGSLYSSRCSADGTGGVVRMGKFASARLTPTGARAVICRRCGLPKIARDAGIAWDCRADNWSGNALSCEYDTQAVRP